MTGSKNLKSDGLNPRVFQFNSQSYLVPIEPYKRGHTVVCNSVCGYHFRTPKIG